MIKPFYLKFLNQVYLIFEYVVWLSVFFSSLYVLHSISFSLCTKYENMIWPSRFKFFKCLLKVFNLEMIR